MNDQKCVLDSDDYPKLERAIHTFKIFGQLLLSRIRKCYLFFLNFILNVFFSFYLLTTDMLNGKYLV